MTDNLLCSITADDFFLLLHRNTDDFWAHSSKVNCMRMCKLSGEHFLWLNSCKSQVIDFDSFDKRRTRFFLNCFWNYVQLKRELLDILLKVVVSFLCRKTHVNEKIFFTHFGCYAADSFVHFVYSILTVSNSHVRSAFIELFPLAVENVKQRWRKEQKSRATGAIYFL